MIPYLSLKAVSESFEPELTSTLMRVMQSGRYLLGEETKKFETSFSAYCGTKHCIGVANGLDALILIMRAWKELGKIREGEE